MNEQSDSGTYLSQKSYQSFHRYDGNDRTLMSNSNTINSQTIPRRNQTILKSNSSQQRIATPSSIVSDDDQSQASGFFRRPQQTIKKKSAFSSASNLNSRRDIPKLNDDRNFMPKMNIISSTELLLNSNMKPKKNITDNDITRATALYDQNYSITDDFTSFPQNSVYQKLESIMEEKTFQDEKAERMKNAVYDFEPPPQFLQRRASEIVGDTEEYLAADRSVPKVVLKSAIFSPYQITNQNELNMLIEKERKKQETEKDYNARILKESSNKNASEILSYLGMNVLVLPLQTNPDEDENQEENTNNTETQPSKDKRSQQQKQKTGVFVPQSGIADPTQPELGISEILAKMNSMTPDQQKLAILNSARGKAHNKANFQEEDKELNKRKINLVSEGIKRQIELDTKKAEEDAAAAILAKARALARGRRVSQGDMSDIDEEANEDGNDDKMSKSTLTQKLPKRIDRQVVRKNFHYENKYESNIYTRVFDNLGKNYVSKYLSQSAFDILDGQEEDPIQTVINSANYGQKVLLIESRPPEIKPIIIKHGKFRKPIFIPEDATEEEINEAKGISTKTYRQVERLKMTIPANIESEKEKDYSRFGRRSRMPLNVPRSHWEEKMVEAGRRKVRFAKQYDLIQFELHKTNDTIFNDPQFFQHAEIVQPHFRQREDLITLGQSKSAFQEIDSKVPKIHALEIPLEKQNKNQKQFFQVFDEQFQGQEPNQTAYQKELNKFERFKEKYQVEFDRLDGFRYKYKEKDRIVAGVRKEDIYDGIIAEEGEKKWRPPDEPQTNPPEVLKEFQIEPNILVYSKNILDIDMNYKDKGLDKKGMRRQGRIGIAESGTDAQKAQRIADNKSPVGNSPKNQDDEDFDSTEHQARQRNGKLNPETGAGALSLQDSILMFQQQMQKMGESGGVADTNDASGSGPQQRQRQQFDFMFQNPADLAFAKMQKIQRAIDENEKVKIKLSEVDQAIFDATPMIHPNILSSKSYFRIHEAEEFERELKAKLVQKQLPNQPLLQKENTINGNVEKQKAQLQMNSMVAALNPINYQFTAKNINAKAIMNGVDAQIEREITKSNKPIIHQQQKQPGSNNEIKIEPLAPPQTSDSKKDTQKPSEVPPSTAQSRNLQSAAKTESSGVTEKQKKSIPQLRMNEIEGKEKGSGTAAVNLVKKDQFEEYGNLLELKTLDDVNEIQGTTVTNMLYTIQKKMKKAEAQANRYQYGDLNPMQNTHGSDDSTRSGISSSQSFKQGPKNVVKNSYLADYGSYLLNAQLDYNTPQFYHKREAEQGLFYLSKNYRDYFEPARDLFAEKDGWDILNKFSHNPKNTHAGQPSVHNYAKSKKHHEPEDILTAFQGLQTMHELNQVAADVNTRNEQNLKRKIAFNQL